jgi:hypothetical protein
LPLDVGGEFEDTAGVSVRDAYRATRGAVPQQGPAGGARGGNRVDEESAVVGGEDRAVGVEFETLVEG